MPRSGHQATESLSLEQAIAQLPAQRSWAQVVLARIDRMNGIPVHARILDVGCAAGPFLVACGQLGYDTVGVEPWPEARKVASSLAEHTKTPLSVYEGSAESLPFEDGTFDIVHASSVIEHVIDLEQSLREIYRVLKPGGSFWFNAASSMCPSQSEIALFPLFGWYPNTTKVRIMNWAKDARPALVGHTRTPAIQWFTPRKARRKLAEAGFRVVYDRWDLRGEDEGGEAYRAALRMIRSSRLTKNLADVAVGGCSYLAVK